MLTKSGIKQLKKYCREPIENIKGYREAVESEERYDCHHINELTFTSEQLKMMNMYYHRPASELIIITHSSHMKLHRRRDMPSALFGEKSPMYGRTGDKNNLYGRTGEKSPMYGRTGDKHPMYGKGYLISGDKNPNWKGDSAGPIGMYKRAKKLYSSGLISEEELNKFRVSKQEYKRQKRNSK